MILLLAIGCEVLAPADHAPLPEGEDDLDPLTFPFPHVDRLPRTPELEVGEVCYPGDDGGAACLPLVAWDASWGSDYAYPAPYQGSPQYEAPRYFVDLAVEDPDRAVAPNFALGELMQQAKGRYGVYQPHVVEYLQAIRDAIGGPLNVNSGYRSPGYNAGLEGSATYSRHMYGDAADIWSPVASLDELIALCEELGAGYIGTYPTHVHCDWRDDPLEPAFYEAP